MDDLIIGALEEGRIDRNDRQQALTGKACRKADGMLLRHANIKEAAGMAVLEEVEAGAVLHGSGDAAQTRFIIAQIGQRTAEGRGKGVLRRKLRVGQMVEINGRYGVKLSGIFLGRLQALALLGDDMQEYGGILLAQVGQGVGQHIDIMAVHRPDVLEAHLLEHRGFVDAAADQLLAALQHLDHGITGDRDALKHRFHVRLDMGVFRVGAQLGQIVGHLADIFGDRHLVVVQNDDQIVQLADIVHALVDHAARKGAIAHNDHDLARLVFEFFGPGDADGRGQRSAAVPSNESVTVALLRAGKARDTVLAAQLRKTGPAAGQQLVGVALVAYIKQQLVLRKIQHTVQSDRQFHNTQIGGQMAARLGNTFDQELPDFLAQGGHLVCGQIFNFSGRIDTLQQGIAHIRTSFLYHRHDKAQHNAERRAGQNFDRCMTDHFLELFAMGKLKLLDPLVHPFGKKAVQNLCLLAGLIAHTHGIVHNDDGQHSRNGKGGRAYTAVPPGGNNHGADGGRVGTGHAARPPHTLGDEAVEDKKIQQHFDKLCQQRCTDRCCQHKIPTQRSAQQWHRNHILISYVPAAPQPAGAESLLWGQAHPARPALRRCGAPLFHGRPAGRTA